MVKVACHCGAVRITVEPAPKWVLDCNCSICRRYGALWAYPNDPRTGEALFQATIVQGSDDLEGYVWGDKWSAVWRCKACGCVMCGTPVGERERTLSVNARMFVDFDPSRVSIQRIDNARTGWFWTRPDAAILKGRQPPMPPPGRKTGARAMAESVKDTIAKDLAIRDGHLWRKADFAYSAAPTALNLI